MFVASVYKQERTKVMLHYKISLSDAAFRFCCYTCSGFCFVTKSSLIMFTALFFRMDSNPSSIDASLLVVCPFSASATFVFSLYHFHLVHLIC